MRTGDFTNSVSGTVASGYSATYGNMTSSSHGWAVGGTGTVNGSFFNPNFLSYNGNVYLNQSRSNSNFQSISNASGVNLAANIFSGSHFPGSITFSEAYNSDGNYDIPGLANYVTHGNAKTLGFNWSENLPNTPSFSAGYQMGTSQYNVYGTSDDGNTAFHSLNLHSGYKLDGFNLGAYFSNGGGHSLIPQVVSGQKGTEVHNGNTAYGMNASHLLPFHGSISSTISRSDWNTNYLATGSNGAIDMVNVLATLHPTGKLSFSGSANYSDNLSGQLLQSIIAGGSEVSGVDQNQSQSSDSLDLLGVASYTLDTSLQGSASVERRTQTFLGENYGVNSYGGGLTYSRALLNGTFNAAGSVTANQTDKSGADTLGFSMTESYSNMLLGWHLTGAFGYAQNAQTLLVTYTNSFYNYSGTARRNWGQFNMSLGAGGSRTGLSQVKGSENSSESYNASLGYGIWLTANGSYSKSDGQALITGAGLTPITVPSPTLPSNLITLFGGNSYSVGVSSTPVKRLIFSAAFARSNSNTTSSAVISANQNKQFNTILQYQTRKLTFNSGFARLEQGFSASGSKPQVVSSFSIGVSRWFNFF